MAKSLPPTPNDHLIEEEEEEEEEYIEMDMDVDMSSANNSFLCYSIISSPPHSNEFEFQMSAKRAEIEATASSPADELFYKGNLLPLHLPPRLQMVQKLLKENTCSHLSPVHSSCSTVSAEVDAGDCCNCSASLVRSQHKSSWSKKLKMFKNLSKSLTLKASKDYLTSLFNKRRRSDGPAEVATSVQIKSCLLDGTNLSIHNRPEKHVEEEALCHRNSFSGAINWNWSQSSSSTSSSSSSLSSSSSFSGASSNRFSQPLLLGSANAELESSIEGAIAHCNKSQQMIISGRKSESDVDFFSLLPDPMIAAASANQARPGISRG